MRTSLRKTSGSSDKPEALEMHDYENCRQRYCLMCFYIDLAIHPELNAEYHRSLTDLQANTKSKRKLARGDSIGENK